MLSSILSLTCLALLAGAQSNPTLELQAIQAQFQGAHIVPDLLQSFNPTALLTFSYNGQVVAAGTPETVDAVKPQPSLTLTVPPGATVGKTFTLAMVDPGAAGSDSSAGQTRHWLVNGVTVGDGGVLNFPTETTITGYGGPLPPDGSGAHRYVFLLYDQPASFAPTGDLATAQPIAVFNVNDYAKSSGLGAIVAASYYTVEIGTATGAVVPTTAVNTGTLPAAQSSTGTGTGTGTGASSTVKPSAKPSGAASHQVANIGLAGVAAFVGVFMA